MGSKEKTRISDGSEIRYRQPKIGLVASSLSNGGLERVASILANYLASKGYQVLFLAAWEASRTYELDERVEYTYQASNSKNKIVKLIQKNINVYKQLKKFKPDLIVSFLPYETFLTEILLNRPSVYSLRNDPNATKLLAKKWIRQYVFSKSKKVVFQTNGARDYFDGKIKEKGIVIGNPIKGNLPRWNEHNHDKVIMTASRLYEQKNISMMIRAFAKFASNHLEYKLKICGDGPLLTELKDLAKTLNVYEKVEFDGFRKDIHDVMAQAMIFAVSSDYEGLSNAMLEAMAIGMPIVCTDSSPGGAATYIKDEVNGMLTPVGNADEFSVALCRVADDEKFRNKLSENAIKIRDDLNPTTVLEKWESVLKDAMN